MNKITVLLLLVILISVSTLNASLYRGQKNFQKNCRACHGIAMDYIDKRNMKEWDNFFDAKGNNLRNVHAKSNIRETEKASLSKYLKSSLFLRTLKHYKEFFVHYASDSGKVLTCD